MMSDDFMTGYVAGQGEGRNNGGMFGGDWGWIILLLLFGGYGYGGFGGMGMMGGMGMWPMLNGMATRADINEGFALQNITSGIQGIQQGICDSTYALTNAVNTGFHNSTVGMMQGFNGVERGFCDLSHQLSDCCCENRAAIADLKYTAATEACATRNLMQNNTRDIIDSQNAGTRAILDFLTQDKISTLTAENQALKFQASQSAQNAYLTATMDANVATILRRTGHDCPTAAYLVQPPTPVNFPTNGCGTVQFGNYGYNGCGCVA
ncbi:MAG: hypothetical protein IJ418_12120 [Clostridia bacterium]|nr:hypothetical protein [Clostridia bacterium]